MIYRFGAFELDDERYELRAYPAARSPLSRKRLMCSGISCTITTAWSPNKNCSNATGQGTFVTESALTRCMAKIRRALQVDEGAPPTIRTIHGQGYHVVATVETAAPPPRRRPRQRNHQKF